MNIVETWSKSGTERFLLKYLEEFEIRFRVFNRNDIGIKSLDSPEDIIEIRLSLALYYHPRTVRSRNGCESE